MKSPSKVLVIGARGLSQVTEDLRVQCCEWTKVSTITNIRDFDTIVLNLLTIGTEELRSAVDWSSFFKTFGFRSTMEILLNGGRLVFVGDPHFEVKLQMAGAPKVLKASPMPFLK